MKYLDELPYDILHNINKLLVEYYPKSFSNIRLLNIKFKNDIDKCIQLKYETDLCNMLSACRIYVSSKKARFKYTLQYIRSMEETREQDKLIHYDELCDISNKKNNYKY